MKNLIALALAVLLVIDLRAQDAGSTPKASPPEMNGSA
jgi:hypothetical protein